MLKVSQHFTVRTSMICGWIKSVSLLSSDASHHDGMPWCSRTEVSAVTGWVGGGRCGNLAEARALHTRDRYTITTPSSGDPGSEVTGARVTKHRWW